ncbi:PREDICTED: piRNA biogenesis protein EXD1-like [Nicrophorus vespilloides]|uniref:PiRNA biogenesis protein EXD1-like n=1 Tax=Nicrophorus vespilloides TaxID=110193 RepID=A0ABM1MYG7_NICVS|nr:PREDICTED: piRNA biogenesis protein EXD1-like [Nicrophorus vespilloides]
MERPFNFYKGDLVYILLKSNDAYEGIYMKGSHNQIHTTHNFHHDTLNRIKEEVTFYRYEIEEITLIKHADSDKNKRMQSNEYERLYEMVQCFTFLFCKNNKFRRAMKQLSQFETISVVGIGCNYGRLCRFSHIAIASWCEVYIVDLASLDEEIPDEIKWLMETTKIKKVTHDARSLIDCLHYCYDVSVRNIFDTQVGDYMLVKETLPNDVKTINGRTISDCLQHYLDFDKKLLEKATKKNFLYRRPLSIGDKTQISQLAAYLIPLKQRQEDLMLKNFREETENYAYSTINQAHNVASKMLTTPTYQL